MTVTDRLYSLKEFLALPDDGKRYELWEGRIHQMSPASGEHAEIGAALIEYLRAYVRPRRLGRVFSDSATFTINAGTRTYLSPDVAFVVAGRVSGRITDEVPVAPDLAVEILSKHDYAHPKDVRAKIGEYQRAGVRLIWIIDPRKMQVQVYRLGQSGPAAIYGSADELSGEGVVQGFTLPVSALFETGD